MRCASRQEQGAAIGRFGLLNERRGPILAVWLLIVAMVTGCVVVQPTEVDSAPLRPVELARHDTVRGRWADVPDAPLALEQAIAIAVKNNPDVSSAAWDLDAARARRRYAEAGHWPTVGTSAAYRHHWHEERLVPARGQGMDADFSDNIFRGDVVLSIPIVSGGRVMSAVAAGELMAKAAEHRLARTKEELVFNVKSTFYAILGHTTMLEALKHSKEALEGHHRTIEELITARKAATVDRLNIEVRIAEIKYHMVKQRGILKISERVLASLLGLESVPSSGLPIQGDLAFRTIPLDSRRLLATALESRSDIAELTLELQAQAKRVDVVRAEYWPVLSGTVSYGARASVEGDYDDLGFAGIEVSLPLFTGLSTAASVQEERAKLRVLQERKRKLALKICREVESVIIRLQTATAQVEATEKAIAKAEESLRIAREKAGLGHGTALEVLDAQTALLDAETAYSTALVDLNTSLALLELTTGKAS